MSTINGGNRFKGQQPVSKQIMFVLLGAGMILLVPLLAMQFTKEVVWDLFDFVVMGTLLVGAGLAYVLTARTVVNPRSRLYLGVALAGALLLIWAELAVGIIGTPFAGS